LFFFFRAFNDIGFPGFRALLLRVTVAESEQIIHMAFESCKIVAGLEILNRSAIRKTREVEILDCQMQRRLAEALIIRLTTR